MWAFAAAARPERGPRLRVGPPLQGQQHWLRVGPPLQGQQHWLRAGAAATRGFRPPRGSASCSNTRARYVHVPLGRNPLAATSFAAWCSSLRRDISLGMPEPISTKPRTSRWRKTRWCGDRAQAGHGWPALACWSQGRRNQAMRPIPAPPRLPPEGDKSRRFGSTQKPALPRLSPKPTDSTALRPHPENQPIMAAGPLPPESPP